MITAEVDIYTFTYLCWTTNTTWLCICIGRS